MVTTAERDRAAVLSPTGSLWRRWPGDIYGALVLSLPEPEALCSASTSTCRTARKGTFQETGENLRFSRVLPWTLKHKVMEVKRHYASPTLLIEDSPISRGLIQSLREKSINVTAYKPDTDKRARVITQIDLFTGGSVRLPRNAEWLEEFVAELLAFPGRHDDQVDALTQGLAWGRSRRGEVSVSFARGLY